MKTPKKSAVECILCAPLVRIRVAAGAGQGREEPTYFRWGLRATRPATGAGSRDLGGRSAPRDWQGLALGIWWLSAPRARGLCFPVAVFVLLAASAGTRIVAAHLGDCRGRIGLGVGGIWLDRDGSGIDADEGGREVFEAIPFGVLTKAGWGCLLTKICRGCLVTNAGWGCLVTKVCWGCLVTKICWGVILDMATGFLRGRSPMEFVFRPSP